MCEAIRELMKDEIAEELKKAEEFVDKAKNALRKQRSAFLSWKQRLSGSERGHKDYRDSCFAVFAV